MKTIQQQYQLYNNPRITHLTLLADMEEKFIVAVEIGSSKIKGALAEVQSSGLLNVLAVHEEPLVDSVRYGQIKNVEEVSNHIDRIRRKLESATAITPRKITGVCVGVSGHTVGSSVVSSTINFDDETEITAATIDRLRQQAMDSVFTEKEVYEVLPRDFTVNNMATPKPVGQFGRTIKGSFVCISGAPGIMSNIKRVLPERLKLNINAVVVSPLAQAQAVLTADECRLGCVFVDFGAETTTVSIYKHGSLQYMVTLPMGSRNITRDLVAITYLEERAEGIKRSVGVNATNDEAPRISPNDSIENPEITNCIYARTSEIIANVVAQIEFSGFKLSDLPAGIIMVGGGARMKGFSDLLAMHSQMNVRTGTAPRNIRISDTSIMADKAVDVIALLLAAGKEDVQSCVEELKVEEASNMDNREFADERDYNDDDYTSRIGIDEDDDILEDDDSDRSNRRTRRPALEEEKRRKDKEKERKRNPMGEGWFSKFKGRLANLVSDPDDKFDDDDTRRNDDDDY